MIPYAYSYVIDGQYGVECPRCQRRFTGSGDTEDDRTKSANSAYAEHFAVAHPRTEAELAVDPDLAVEVRVANAMQPYFHNYAKAYRFACWLVLNWSTVKRSVQLPARSPRDDSGEAYRQFMAMPDTEWAGLVASLLAGGVLETAEQEGFQQALLDRRHTR